MVNLSFTRTPRSLSAELLSSSLQLSSLSTHLHGTSILQRITLAGGQTSPFAGVWKLDSQPLEADFNPFSVGFTAIFWHQL